ncbi:ABC transporter permease [Actinophytocola sediminis]
MNLAPTPRTRLRITGAVTRRVLTQLRHDPATVAMLLIVPPTLVTLLHYVIDSPETFDRVGPALLGTFPFLVMFMVVSITTLRERTLGTLERLMTLPMARVDLLAGYAIAFGVLAVAQVAVTATVALTWLGLDVAGPLGMLLLVATLGALLGMALGLFISAFARTEFQTMQFMPAIVAPQLLLCGLFAPRDEMATALRAVSDALPLSYVVDALNLVTVSTEVTAELVGDLVVIAACALLALAMGAATLRRRTT